MMKAIVLSQSQVVMAEVVVLSIPLEAMAAAIVLSSRLAEMAPRNSRRHDNQSAQEILRIRNQNSDGGPYIDRDVGQQLGLLVPAVMAEHDTRKRDSVDW